MPLHRQILIGLLVGAAAGLAANWLVPTGPGGAIDPTLGWVVGNIARPIGQVFLNLIFMVVIPLVFCALVLGVAEMGDVWKLGRVGLAMLLLTVVLSSISAGIGLTLVNTVKPGESLDLATRTELRERFAAQAGGKIAQAAQAKPLRQTLLDIIPQNPLREAVGALDGSSPGGGMLAVMFFALMFGVALSVTRDRTGPLLRVLEGLYDVVMTIISFAMRLAPYAVAGLTFAITAEMGLDIVRTLAGYVITVIAGLTLQMVVVYSAVLMLVARMSPVRFFKRTSEAFLTALGTSSSNATLPVTLRVAESKLGLRRDTANFVLTVGATANQNGTALYEGVTVLFLAQVFGVDLTLTQQVTVAVMCILAGVGTAGVPGGSLPLIVIVLQSVGVPAEGIGIILGVDRILDMCRTTVNVTGDLAIAACVDSIGGTGSSAAAAAPAPALEPTPPTA